MLHHGTMAISKTIATMKNIFKNLMLVAVAAMAFVACQNEPNEINVTAKKVAVNISGDLEQTRSYFGEPDEDAKTYPSKWSGGEKVVFSLNAAALVEATNTLDGTRATFGEVAFNEDGKTVGTIYAFSPKGTFNGSSATDNVGGFTNLNTEYDDAYVVIPDVQTPTATSVDPSVHLLAGEVNYTDGLPSAASIKFKHVAAYAKMTIKNFTEPIEKVDVTASAPLAGSSCWYYYAGDTKGKLTNANKKTITIINPAEDNYDFWFGCAPANLADGTLSVKVYAANGDTYTKELAIAGKNFAFHQGGVSRFSVSITAANKDEALTIEDGQYVVAGKVGDVYYAMDGANQTTAATIASKEITVTDGKVAAADAAGYVWTVAAAEGGYTFFNGEHYLLASSASGTSLKTQEEPVVWALGETGDDGYIFISPKADNRYLMFNGDSGTNKFGAYAQANYAKENYSGIYLLPIDGVIKTPLAKPALTATVQNANEIVVSWGAVTGAKDYTVTFDNGEPETVTSTEKTYTGLAYSTDYTITVVANPENEEQYIASTASATVRTGADPSIVVTEGYKLITTLPELTTGEYVIAAKVDDTYYAMGNTIASKIGAVVVNVSANNVISTSDAEGKVWNITRSGDDITIKSGSNYLKYKSSADFANGDTTAYNWTPSVADANTFRIIASTSSGRAILYQESGNRFGPYSTSNTSGYFDVMLFKKTTESGGGTEPDPDDPVQLAQPTGLSATATTNTATVTWTAVANASSYNVTVGITTQNVTTTTATFDGLYPDATYNVSVVAVGDGVSYINSEAATTTVKTLAEGGSGGDATPGWVRVTSTDMILSGGTFIIGYEATAKSGKIVPMRSDATGAKTTANGFHYSGTGSGTTSNNSTIDMNTITDTSKYQVTITTSTTVSGAINIQLPNGNYIGANNSKNTARLYSSAGANTAYGVSIGENDVVTLKCAAADAYHTLQYNTGSPRFANYGGAMKNLVLYKLQ